MTGDCLRRQNDHVQEIEIETEIEIERSITKACSHTSTLESLESFDQLDSLRSFPSPPKLKSDAQFSFPISVFHVAPCVPWTCSIGINELTESTFPQLILSITMEPSLSLASPQTPVNKSIPSPLSTSGSQQTPSIISSHITDIASEDGDGIQREWQATSGRPTTAASIDPNRPGSAMSSQTRPSTRAPPSRRGMGSPTTIAPWRTGGAFGGPGGSMTNSSRPPSATSRTSRTHVPSLASHAFFRPMSSQRLQAQRGFRPTRLGNPAASVDGSSEGGTHTNRHSLVSDATLQQNPQIQRNNDIPPPSRGTEFTEQDDGGTVNASPTEYATLRSVGESDRQLQSRTLHPRPMQLDIEKQGNGSPKSFRANFHRAATSLKETQGHERLSSSNNSPTFAKKQPDIALKAGINYQYFSGNTVFCWGGRLQNARDRPINIASGIIVVLPTIFFLVYS